MFAVWENFIRANPVHSAGTYHFAGHMENSACQPSENEKILEIVAGETFPPCRHCKTDAFWEIKL